MGTWNRLFPWRHKNPGESNPAEIKFVPRLTLSRNYDWVYLELVLENHSEWTVWVEEATIVLTDLDANCQTGVPTGQATHKIRQNVIPGDTLSVSLASSVYDAAGRPQGAYSCFIFTDVRYRVFNEWCNAQLEASRVEMRALTVLNLNKRHWYNKKMKHAKGPVDLTTHRRRS
jgi:hypothetical protein